MTKTFKVKIGSVYVSKMAGDSTGHYNFDFWLYEGKKLKEWGNMDGSFEGRTASAFRKVLKRGWAHILVLQRYY